MKDLMYILILIEWFKNFILIYRDKQIQALKRKLNGEDETQINQWLEDEYEKLKEDFEFIANVNIGGEFLDEKFMPEIENSKGNRWLTTLTFKDKNPLKVMEILRDNQIESRPLWKPMHLQPLFKNSKNYLNGVSEELFKKGLCLPSGTKLTKKDVKKICEVIDAV